MINKQNFKALLEFLGFKEEEDLYIRSFGNGSNLKVDFRNEKLVYPDKLKVHEKQTCNFSSPENTVVFECVYQLLSKGYKPEHIELEPEMGSWAWCKWWKSRYFSSRPRGRNNPNN